MELINLLIKQINLLSEQIASIVTQIVGYGLLLLIAAAVLQRYGVRVPGVPATGPTELAYLAGAWFLYRGR